MLHSPMHDNGLQAFIDAFRLEPDNTGKCGVEVELFTAKNNLIVPAAPEVMARLQDTELAPWFSPEFSACQIEFKTPPVYPEDMHAALIERQTLLHRILKEMQLEPLYAPIAPENMPLDIYPLERYTKEIAPSLTREQLLSAFRVAGLHIHYGTHDMYHALYLYNKLAEHFSQLLTFGDKSNGARRAVYRKAASDWQPARFADLRDLYQYACEHGFTEDLRRWWSELRISHFGTVELRSPDTTPDMAEAATWVRMYAAWCKGF